MRQSKQHAAKADYDYLSSIQHLLTDVPPHTHTRIYRWVCVCVSVCVLAIVLIPCLQLISHDFIHVYSKKKLFNAFKCKQSAHTLTLTHTHCHTHTHSECYIHVSVRSYTLIHLFSNSAHSFRRSRLPFHFFPCFFIFPYRLDFFFLPLHICLNDLIYIFPMLADLFVLVMDMRLLKSLPPLGGDGGGGGGSHDIREIS